MTKRDRQSGWARPGFFLHAFLLFLFGLTSCARFENKPLSPSVTAERFDQRSLTNQELKLFVEKNLGRELSTWPPALWDLDVLMLVAFYSHPGLQVARSQWMVAQAAQKTAGQRPNPTLNVTPGYNSTTAMASPWLPLTYLDVPLETAGKRSYRQTHANHLAEAARLNVVTVAWQIRASLRSHLLEYQTANAREKLLTRQLDLQDQIVKALQQQVQAGALAGTELFPLRIALIKLRLELADTERVKVEARTRIAEDLAMPISALKEIRFAEQIQNDETITDSALDNFRTTALRNRADILGALAEYAGAQSALQLEIAKQYPDIHLQPGYQYDQGDNKWSLGLLVELPILNQNQGPIAEAKARREEAAAKFNALQSRVLAEIDRAAELLRVARRTVGTLQAMTTAQSERRDAIAAQFKAGAVDQLELLNADSESIAAQVVQMDGQLRLQQAIGTLEDALQLKLNLPSEIFDSSTAKAR